LATLATPAAPYALALGPLDGNYADAGDTEYHQGKKVAQRPKPIRAVDKRKAPLSRVRNLQNGRSAAAPEKRHIAC
jgi:hypothetical protein